MTGKDDAREAQQLDAAHEASASQQNVDGASTGDGAELDFESLDLSVETVEERISPSETNVFDK